jgi:hypothetical protein
MNEMIKHLSNTGAHFLYTKWTPNQMRDTIKVRIIGRRADRNSLNREFDGKGPLTS